MAVSLVVFDCDGVILESVEVKTRAFGAIVEEHGPDAVARMSAHHLANGGVSRFRKFEWFYHEVLGCKVSDAELQELNRKFRLLVFDGVMRASLVPGIMDALTTLQGRVSMYVASGTPQVELRQILSSRDLMHYFKGVYGAPPGKTELLQSIIAREGVMPHETVMVGDSVTDLHAAEHCGALFWGVGADFVKNGSKWPGGIDCSTLVPWLVGQGIKLPS